MANDIPLGKYVEYQFHTFSERLEDLRRELVHRIDRLEQRERDLHNLDERLDGLEVARLEQREKDLHKVDMRLKDLEGTAKILKLAAGVITAILMAVIVGWAQRMF